MSSYTPKLSEIQQDWYLVDATSQTLGRLASEIAQRLRGKHKPTFAKHMDNGDYMVVVNCDHMKVTGNKNTDKLYHRHTGYPGGIKTTSYRDMMQKDPCEVLRLAVKGMLPRGPLGRQMLTKLKLFAGSEHNHSAQQPKPLALNAFVGDNNE